MTQKITKDIRDWDEFKLKRRVKDATISREK
jgi:hypothetical protein